MMKKGDVFYFNSAYFICTSTQKSTSFAKRIICGAISQKTSFFYKKLVIPQILPVGKLPITQLTIRRIKASGCIQALDVNVTNTAINVFKKEYKLLKLYYKNEYVYIKYTCVTYKSSKNVFVIHNVTKC